jgi:hypothetical protein
MLLRGRNFETQEYSNDLRVQQFIKLKEVLDDVLDVQHWNDFIKCIQAAGYVSKTLISSQNALVYSYAFFLIGKKRFKMKPYELRKLVSKWFFMVSASGYYSSSPESTMEADLADIRNMEEASDFVKILQKKIDDVFTNDYFGITMPNALATSSPRNPAWFGYCAALNVLDAKVLFSSLHTKELFDPFASGSKKALEKHHLFPKAYLKKIGIEDNRSRNQNANFAFIEWTDNIEILDQSPSEYMKEQLEKIPASEKAGVYENHALPDEWQHMDYFEFLKQRQLMMAKTIRKGYERLKNF